MKDKLIQNILDGFELDITEQDAVKALNTAILDFEQKTQISPFIYKDFETKDIVVTVARDTQSGANALFLDNYINEATITIDGTELVEGTDYELIDRSMVAFFTRKLTSGLTISINAKWGFAQHYPDDVEQALLLRATCTILESKRPQLLLASRMELNTLRLEFNGVGNNLRTQLLETFNQTVELYRFNQGYIG